LLVRVHGSRVEAIALRRGSDIVPIGRDRVELAELPIVSRLRSVVFDVDGEAEIAALTGFADAHPGYAPALMVLAATVKREGMHADARRTIERALDTAPDDAQAHFVHGDILDEINEDGLALHAYACAIALDPSHDGACNQRAMLLKKHGRLDD